MASRVVEVVYKLKDLFTGQVQKITGGYKDLEKASDDAADAIDKNTDKNVKA